MPQKLNRTEIAKGVYLTVINDSKFKHNRMSINLITPIKKESVAENALLSYVLRKGCESYDDFLKLNRRLDFLYGSNISTDVSKISGNQLVTFTTAFIDDKYTLNNESLTQDCTQLLCDVILHPLIKDGEFSKDEISVESKNLIDSINALINDKRAYAVTACRELMGRGSEQSLRKYGTAEAVEKITSKSLADAYYKLIETAQVEILFVGAGDSSKAKTVLAKEFSAIKRNPVAIAKMLPLAKGEAKLEKTERFDVAQSKLVLGFGVNSCETAEERAAARVMTALYGGTPSSKLFLNVREKLSLCYYCAARYDKAANIILVDCGVEKDNIEKAKAEILNQLNEIKQGTFELDQLDKTKNLLKNAFTTINDSPSTIEDWYLQRIITNDICTPQEELARVMAVTAEDITTAANKVYEDAVYLLTGKEEI